MKTGFVYRNSLSIAFIILFILAMLAQVYFGWKENSKDYEEAGKTLALSSYLFSGHFIAATFENFQSEFLQMAMYVFVTIYLRQQGSAESKKIGVKEEVDREPIPHENAPYPVKKGGFILKIYENSLTIAFLLLFILSAGFHFYGSFQNYKAEQVLAGKPDLTLLQFINEPRFWFETFQNWQSEFLSVASIVILSIFLRQKGSPESKPVDSPNSETGK